VETSANGPFDGFIYRLRVSVRSAPNNLYDRAVPTVLSVPFRVTSSTPLHVKFLKSPITDSTLEYVYGTVNRAVSDPAV